VDPVEDTPVLTGAGAHAMAAARRAASRPEARPVDAITSLGKLSPKC
jgi:hypothetical protein